MGEVLLLSLDRDLESRLMNFMEKHKSKYITRQDVIRDALTKLFESDIISGDLSQQLQ